MLRGRVDELTRVKGELEAANIRLEALADHDGLTGLLNRRSLEKEMTRRWESALRLSEPLAVLMVDIDHFKAYNDTYGHQAGDECLITVASAIGSALERLQDTATRYGGEEFLVLLPGTDLTGAVKVASRILAAVKALGIPHKSSGVAAVVSVSVGVAATVPDRQASPAGLIEQADSRLYRAKSEGRNRLVYQ